MVHVEADQLVEVTEVRWGVRYEKRIRETIESASGAAAPTAIAETVRRLGLEPYKAPDPLPPIEEQEIRLNCWMAVGARRGLFRNLTGQAAGGATVSLG